MRHDDLSEVRGSAPVRPVGVSTEPRPRAERGPAHRVLIFRKLLLPVSETFILDQYSTYRRWQPTLLGYQRVPGLDLDHVDAVVVAKRLTLGQRLRLKIYQHGQFVGYVPSGFRALLAAQRPDLIHAHFGYDAILVSDAARQLGVPLVVTLHGDDVLRHPDVWRSGSKGQFFRLYPRKLKRLFDERAVHFIAVSHAVAERAVAQGAAPERMHVRYTGTRMTHLARADMRDRRPEVLFVGRLVEVKGCEYLIRAMALVRQEVAEARLVVIGDGPLRDDLENLANRLGVPSEFLGGVPRSVVQARMAAARVLCLPSVTDSEGAFEAFGMVILEAMGAGLAVVTSAKGGSEAVRHGRTGFVTAERDVTAMAAHIGTLIRDDVTFQQMTRLARDDAAARFELQSCTAAIEDLYDTILGVRP